MTPAFASKLPPGRSRALALGLLVIVIAVLAALLLVPALLLHRHYDEAIESANDRLARYKRVASQAPDLGRLGVGRDLRELLHRVPVEVGRIDAVRGGLFLGGHVDPREKPHLVVRVGDPALVPRGEGEHRDEGRDRDDDAGDGEYRPELDPPEAPDREIDEVVEFHISPPGVDALTSREPGEPPGAPPSTRDESATTCP